MFVNEANGISYTEFLPISDTSICLRSNKNLTIDRTMNGDFDVYHFHDLVDSDLSLETAVETINGIKDAKLPGSM